MNIPFKFTYAATNNYGVLWNPHNLATGGTDIANALLTALVEPTKVGMVPPLGNVYVTGLVIMTDDVGLVPVTLGYYDTVAGAFVALYPILTTAVSGSGVSDVAIDSLYLPLGKTGIPCLRNDGAGAGVVSGHVRLFVPPPASLSASDNSMPLTDEANGYALLDQVGQVLLSENAR